LRATFGKGDLGEKINPAPANGPAPNRLASMAGKQRLHQFAVPDLAEILADHQIITTDERSTLPD
jgi:hypothetical protein